MKKLYITVIGESRASRKNFDYAEEVGERLAKHGAILFCGGRGGVMEGVCKGAKKAGGLTVGILPSGKRAEANPYVDIPIPTGIGWARNKIVVKSGQAVIAIGGSYGTLCEIAYALSYEIPVIGLNTWKMVKKTHKNIPIKYVKSPKEAVDLAIKIAKRAKT